MTQAKYYKDLEMLLVRNIFTTINFITRVCICNATCTNNQIPQIIMIFLWFGGKFLRLLKLATKAQNTNN